MSDELESRLAGLREAGLTDADAVQLEALKAAAGAGGFQHRRTGVPVLPAAVAVVMFVAAAAALGLGLGKLQQASAGPHPVAPSIPVKVAPSPGPTPTPQPAPSPLVPLVSGDRIPFSNVTMVSPSAGWTYLTRQAYGEGPALFEGYVLHTNDGGLTWADVTPSGIRAAFINKGFFLDAAHGWVVVDDPIVSGRLTATVWRTADGGVTWKSSGPVGDPLFARGPGITFLDAQHGWMSAPSEPASQDTQQGIEVDTTSDGGATWKRMVVSAFDQGSGPLVRTPIPFACGKAGSAFRDTRTGWVTGGCLGGITFYRTDDGGSTWHQQAFRGPSGAAVGANDCSAGPCALTPPVFTSVLDATMTFSYYGVDTSRAALYATHDGGATWTSHPLPGVGFFGTGPSFLRAGEGWAGILAQGPGAPSPGIRVFRTTDGGVTWGPLADVPGYDSAEFDFVNPSVGFGVFDESRAPMGVIANLFMTLDGGQTWRRVDARYR